MARVSASLGKLLYGLLFIVILPAILVLWAYHTREVITIPLPFDERVGVTIGVVGLILMAKGMFDLWVTGGGLPMNAYPPRHYVTSGIFRLLPHPIYTGFVLLVGGISLALQSSSGFWFITPIVALSSVALVIGYERLAMQKLYGDSLARLIGGTKATRFSDSLKLTLYAVVLVALESGSRFVVTHVDETATVELTSMLLLVVSIVASQDRRSLSRILLIASVLHFFTTLVVGYIAPLSVALAIALTGSLGRRFSHRAMIYVLLSISVAVLLGWSAFHAVSLAAISAIAIEHVHVWDALRRSTEWIANSWHEWHLGPLRIINHGAYTGIGAAIGLLLMDHLTGGTYLTALLLVSLSCLLGAAIWAQVVEGSDKLLRPFGFYGGAIGILLSTPFMALIGAEPWVLFAALSVALPWVQALGRLRCLVQGCCHGAPTAEHLGIRYRHPLSRVNRISGLAGRPLHPTQLYSIATNVMSGIILYRLWSLGADLALISGSYLVLNGISRFVEEAYRGETQTKTYFGLRFYQWLALTSVALGILFSGMQAGPVRSEESTTVLGILTALCFGLLTWFAQGVDFPRSSRRFSRLT